MTRWKRRVPIKQFLDPDRPVEEVRDAVVGVLKSQPEYGPDLNEIDDDYVEIVDELAEVDSVPYLDTVLDALYDWADENRVWIGHADGP